MLHKLVCKPWKKCTVVIIINQERPLQGNIEIKYSATTFLTERFFPGGTKASWKNTEIPGVIFLGGGGGGYDKHPHLLTTMPCLKRDEACWCTEAFISKRSTIFNCESVRLPNAWLWSIGKSFGWVQLFDYWTQLKSIEQIGVQLGSIDYTEMYSSMRFQ